MAPSSPSDPGARPTPATRDQVDAYRFGLRRWESALVRGDPVPLHEQVRAQRRAVAVGAALGVLVLAAALVTGLLTGPTTLRSATLVLGRPSGALYAVARDPERLVPVANTVAGRLVLAALRPSPPGRVTPEVVDDRVLAPLPRTPAAAVAGAVAADPGARVAPRWAICDEVAADAPQARLVGSTVFAGTAPLPAAALPGPGAPGVLLAVPGGATWLVTGGRRHRVDPRDAAVRAALGVADRVPRPASAGLVSALPEGPPLVTPAVPGAGARGPAGVPGRVGDVVVSRPAGGGPRRYVVVAGGLQELSPLAADVLAAASGTAPGEVGPEVVARVPAVRPLPLDGWPADAPRLVGAADAAAVCWTWSGEPGADPAGGVYVGARPAGVAVALARADGPGPELDAAVVGVGGTVRATAPGVAAGAGTLWVVSASGVAHGVTDGATAAALGVGDVAPAPEAALRLLPVGPVLDVGAAGRAVDVAASG